MRGTRREPIHGGSYAAIHGGIWSRTPTHTPPPTVGWWPRPRPMQKPKQKPKASRHFGAIAVAPSALIRWKQRRSKRRSKRGHDRAQLSRSSELERSLVRQSKVTLGPSSLRSRPSRSKPSRSKAAAAVPRFHCAPAHCQRVGTGGLAGPYAAMDGGIRAYMDVLAAGPANPPVHAQARANPTLKAVAPSDVAPKSCCSKELLL